MNRQSARGQKPRSGGHVKVVLVTSFEDYFLEQDTLPALARRGVEVLVQFEARHVANYDLAKYKAEGALMILHMHEVGGHDSSRLLTERARIAGLPIKALSRKKASWTFLPSPTAPDSEPKSLEVPEVSMVQEVEPEDTTPIDVDGKVRLHPGLDAPDSEGNIPEPVRDFMVQMQFDRKKARLRDVVQLVIAHGVTDFDLVFSAIETGRRRGVFPRLTRVKGDMRKLVGSMLEQELDTLRAERGEGKIRAVHMFKEDRKEIEALGLETGGEDGYIHTVKLPPKKEDETMQKTNGNGAHSSNPIIRAVEPVNNPRDIRAAMVAFARTVLSVKAAPNSESFVRFLQVAKNAGLTIEDVLEALGE